MKQTPEERREYYRQYHIANKERRSKQAKEYKVANSEKVAALKKAQYEANKPARLAAMKAYREANPEKVAASKKRSVDKNKDHVYAKKREWTVANAEHVREWFAAWRKANPEIKRALAVKRRAAQLQQTPAWYSHEDCVAIYKALKPGHHIDHIIPLQGELVSGLHWHHNLQLIPAADNLSKGNKFDPDTYVHELPFY